MTRRKANHRVLVDADGISFGGNGIMEFRCRWADVQRIIAYQTDEFSIDTRWLQFDCPGGPLRISEDVAGYGELERKLGECLPVAEGWQESVARTAFDRNETLVFQRSAQP